MKFSSQKQFKQIIFKKTKVIGSCFQLKGSLEAICFASGCIGPAQALALRAYVLFERKLDSKE
ncbi:hypothetical protein [Comamonas odontotermitis]|uniref:hypothetical protein n=1 Tax=Comamonas odontotermitis TaxID=379895 RepID=UPI001CC5BB63|nr:hypothetical protein [Comamonas odontotermitis]UBB15740.1 hypothetical protein LAD35_12815 [Comamonas odontotermitis]